MTKNNTTVLDAGTSLLFSIFDRAFAPTLGAIKSPNELLSEHETLVDGSCRILKWLGLAAPDSNLAFGCVPTRRLERMFVKRCAHPIKDREEAFVSIEDSDVLNSIFDAAVPEEDQPYVCPLARILLHVLGLVRYADDGVIPTRELRQLAAERREEERTNRWLKSIEAEKWPPTGVRKAIG